jgi:hypothetical protein
VESLIESWGAGPFKKLARDSGEEARRVFLDVLPLAVKYLRGQEDAAALGRLVTRTDWPDLWKSFRAHPVFLANFGVKAFGETAEVFGEDAPAFFEHILPTAVIAAGAQPVFSESALMLAIADVMAHHESSEEPLRMARMKDAFRRARTDLTEAA